MTTLRQNSQPFNITSLKKYLNRLLDLNRTIVSDDMELAADLIDQAVGRPARRYRYKSGAEFGSWIVPPSWNVREAWVSDGKRRIASYRDHPLFLAPYSESVNCKVDRATLLDHTHIVESFDDAFFYEHRLAYDFNRRLRDWRISLPSNVVEDLDGDEFHVRIDTDVHPGTMNVLEYTLPGTEATTVGFLTHLCHPGQANDGLSGVLAGVALLRRLGQHSRRFNYKLLVMPETIGSVIHIIDQKRGRNDFDWTIFLETMAAGDRLCLKHTRESRHRVDLAIETIRGERGDLDELGFFDGYCNDELMFDFVNVGIPSAGIQHYPYDEYHTSRDNASIFDWEKFERSISLVEELCLRLEQDRRVRLRDLGAPYLSRYALYADAQNDSAQFWRNSKLLSMTDGRKSILEMSHRLGIPFREAGEFFAALEAHGLVEIA